MIEQFEQYFQTGVLVSVALLLSCIISYVLVAPILHKLDLYDPPTEEEIRPGRTCSTFRGVGIKIGIITWLCIVTIVVFIMIGYLVNQLGWVLWT